MVNFLNLNEINKQIILIKILFFSTVTVITFLRICDEKNIAKRMPKYYVLIITLSIITYIIRNKISYLVSMICYIFLLSLLCCKISNYSIGYCLIVTIISISLNYILLLGALIIIFFINLVVYIQSDYINLTIIIMIHCFILLIIGKIRRIKNGISYLKLKSINIFFNIIMLNLSSLIIFSVIIFSTMPGNSILNRNLFIGFLMFSIIMFITIKQSIEAYYKQKLLIQDLNETKKELEEKKKEIEELESENLNFSKKSHSLAHKQKSLEFKINKLLMNSENAKEFGIEDDLKNLSKELYENSKLPQLEKTGITEIDDMLNVMQEECRINGIDFSLQLKGNIYQMTNNFVTKEELSILLADHIKDAIIAINHTDNINKSIMVRLGKIDENFGLYIYDSGIEFPKEVLENLGKKPITTYSDEGGTGMGFMNTFDTLKKHNASLIIESIGKPSKDNYTKVIKIIFDNKYQKIYK